MKKKYRMSRGGRLALNLVLLCVLVVFIWGLLGFSSPTLRGSQPEQPGDLPPLTQQWEKTYSAAGELLKDGAVLFHIAVEEDQDEGGPPEDLILSDTDEWDLYWSGLDRRGVDCAMEAVFYDAEGRELERAVLATTEEGGGPWTGG